MNNMNQKDTKGYIIRQNFDGDSDNYARWDIVKPNGDVVVREIYTYQIKEELKRLPDLTKTKQEYLDSLDKGSLLSIIKYGLRDSDAPADVTVEDIYEVIGCFYINDVM